MDATKLRKHQEKLHPLTINKSSDFYMEAKKIKLMEFDGEDTGEIGLEEDENEKLALGSLIVAHNVAKYGVSYQTGENFFKKTLVEMATAIFPSDVADMCQKIPLSSNTISRKIKFLSELDEKMMISELKASESFAIQLDESTDVCKNSVLVVFVRYRYEKQLKTELLFCKNMATTTKGKDIFNIINDFFEAHKLQWSQVCSVSTDGAASMTGDKAGLKAYIRKVSF
jgi:hypothetical protein